MNGQMYQACCIVAAAKNAMRENQPVVYTPAKYENRTEFYFLPKKRLFKAKAYTAQNVLLWFEYCRKKGLQDIKFLCPVAVDNRSMLGFSNTTESCILCFYKDAGVTFFTPDWQFDSSNKKWNVIYTEHEWPDPPDEKPHFENNITSFRKVLEEIRDLASKIECDDFAKIFEKALCVLNRSAEYTYESNGLVLPSAEQRHIFEAAGIADVFGAMGSWNDSPPYMAHEKGLDAEYKSLSDELLKNIRLAVLYAINEW